MKQTADHPAFGLVRKKKNSLFLLLGFIVMVLCFCGCGGDTMKTPPGTLVGIHYDRVNGSVANDEFHIYVTPENFTAEYWPENTDEWVGDTFNGGWTMTEKSGKVSEEQWKAIEETVLTVYPKILPAKKKEGFFAKLKKKFVEEPMILDGGDRSSLCLEWKTPEGIVTENVGSPQGTNGYRFDLLLKELADPAGREIPQLEKEE